MPEETQAQEAQLEMQEPTTNEEVVEENVEEAQTEETEDGEEVLEGQEDQEEVDEITEELEEAFLPESEHDKKKVVVKDDVTGEEREITVKELRDGFMMQRNYTKKTQELSEERKIVDKTKEAYNQNLDNLTQIVNNLSSAYSAVEPSMTKEIADLEHELSSVDVLKLGDDDFKMYNRKKIQLDKLRENKQAYEREIKDKQELFLAEDRKARALRREEEAEQLVKAIPEMADPDKGAAINGALRDYVTGHYGTDAKEFLDDLLDHRHVVLIHKAYKYDLLQSKVSKPKKVNNPVKVQRTDGAKKITNDNDRGKDLFKKARKSQSRSDLISYIAATKM